MLQQQNEVLIQQQYILERSMYRLDPAPPKLPPQEYINRYFDENDEKYLLWYLHDQEPMLNKIAQSACERYAMAEHFADMKQASVFGIWTALQKYDPTVGTPFTVFQKRYIADSIEEYIRTSQSGVVTMSPDTYPVMKRIIKLSNFGRSMRFSFSFTVSIPQPISTLTMFGITLSVMVIVVPMVQPFPA